MTRLVPALVAAFLILAAVPASAAPIQPAAAPALGPVAAMVAPVALYPDALLLPILMAATYPAELAEAEQWLKAESNARLRGDALAVAIEPRPWAPSVKALVPFPETLAMLATRPDWSGALGKAFAADPAAVLAAVQNLRHRALATGKLQSSPRLVVRTEGATILIAPADPAIVNIPVYNPALVYGAWPDAENPPKFIEPPQGFRVSGADIETGIGFSIGFGTIAPLWGWAHADWAAGTVAIDTAAYNRINRYGPHSSVATWAYEPHSTGYFHITAAEATPLPPPMKHDRTETKVTHKAGHHPSHAVHAARRDKDKNTRHATSRNRHDRRRAASPPHRGKIRVASDQHRR